MKPVSTLTLTFAIAAGLTLTTAIPAAHAKKEKAPAAAKGPAPELSAPYRKAFGDLQAAVKAANAADIQTKITALEPLASLPDEKYYLGVMRFELSKLTKDRATTRKAVNEMLASGSKLMTNMPDLAYNAGALAYEAGDYADAIAKLAEADRLGSKDINRLLLGAEANFKTNQPAAGLAILGKAVAEYNAGGTAAPQDWYRRALSVSLKSKLSAEATKWSRDLVRAYPTSTNWRDALVIYRDGSKLDPLVQLDIFRLMRQTKALAGERDFYDYAEVANARALPGEAKAIIDEGFASSAVPRTSKAVNEMLVLANSKITSDKASVAADEKRARASADGKLAANTGNAYLAYDNFPKAIELLTLALDKKGVDADAVNTRLGIAYARAGQNAEARKAFASVLGTRSEIARFWQLYLDINP